MNVWYIELQEGEFINFFWRWTFFFPVTINLCFRAEVTVVLEMFLNYELKAFHSHLTMGVNRFGR